MLVYRNTAVTSAAAPVLTELRERVAAGPSDGAALLCAGALECALADIDAAGREDMERLTDAIADAWLGVPRALDRARDLLTALCVPASLSLARPEGFAFYALDPASFRALARSLGPSLHGPCAVLGVRSIGTTLSAVVRAELARQGIRCERRTVRPTGHPFERTLTWSAKDRAFLARFGADASYIVVDEGPGLSGSTLLAVAEALESYGIPRERIRVFCSHAPDPESLVTPNAAKRWSRFASHAAPHLGGNREGTDASFGLWRRAVYASEADWPAAWVEHERVKYWSRAGDRLLKFEGFPPYDEAPLARAQLLADAGWSPKVCRGEPGFLAFEWLEGHPLDLEDRGAMVSVLSRYLAFRVEALPALASDAKPLETMTRVNVSESVDVELPPEFALEVRSPIHADGHLMPHEWIRARGDVWKTDAVDHGDDHFYPGPCDVAWDLAGAVIEWDLGPSGTETLLRDFARLTGDDAHARLPAYLVAYASFRVGLSTFAERNTGERERWRRARLGYERQLREALRLTLPRT